MFINGIDFPNEIIEALKRDKLVVFAGAGASMDAPTSLPSFEHLARKIAEGTGAVLKDNDSCENFLGYLKSKEIDVNKQAAELLSDSCLEPNKMHEAIIDLFRDSSKIKIVTTNYDQMFEKVLEKREDRVPVYNVPALPLGSDVDGIIHIHGNVNNPRYMVVTDEDFGVAYLTEGYAARFLTKLFESYTVLFIGYSYKDTILRYLTRAMAKREINMRFILTDDQQADWNTLGLTPVWFPKKDFSKMKAGIIRLGQMAKRGLLEWENQFIEFKNEPPKDLSLHTEVDYCLSNIEKARVLANSIHGREWFSILNNKKVFDNLFLSQKNLSEFDQVWLGWFVAEFVGKEDTIFKELYFEKGIVLHPQLASAILRKLCTDEKNISNKTYREYITVLEEYISSSWEIFHLIKILSKRNEVTVCYNLFMQYYKITYKLEKELWSDESELVYKHTFMGEEYWIKQSWESCKEGVLQMYAERLLYFVKKIICELYDKYRNFANGKTFVEPWSMAMLVIEDREDYSKEDPLSVLCCVFCECCKVLEQERPLLVQEFIANCLKEPSVLLRKVALKALREFEKVSSSGKFDIFINNSSISFFGGKEQIFLLIAEIFNDLTEDRKDRLIDEIVAQNEYDDNRHNEYQKYNWCVWIKRFCDTNSRINKLEEDILSKNKFKPRTHPELDIESSSVVWIADQSPITQETMMKIDNQELLEWLNTYMEEPFLEGPSRNGMLGIFSKCIKENYNWALRVIQIFVDGKVEKEDAWDRLFYGIEDSKYGIKELNRLLNLLVTHIEQVKSVLGLSRVLLETVRKEEMKKEFVFYEKDLCKAANIIWDYRKEDRNKFERLIDTTLNTILGNVLLSQISMLSYYDSIKGIPDTYRNFFEKNLNLSGKEKNIVLCILAGHFNFFCCRDKNWCMNNLSKYIEGIEQESFSAVWEGIVYYSRYLNKDIADVVAPIYLKAVTHIVWLNGEARKGFIDLYLLLLIYVIEDPCLKYIPEFYRVTDENDWKEFVQGIGYRLKHMEIDQKRVLWESWLKKYLISRYENKPTLLTEVEKQEYVNWILELEEEFGEIVRIICKEEMPIQVDTLFLYKLDKSKLVEKYPQIIIGLLIKMLNANTELDNCEEYIGNIYKNAKGLNQKEKADFQESLLKRNIRI